MKGLFAHLALGPAVAAALALGMTQAWSQSAEPGAAPAAAISPKPSKKSSNRVAQAGSGHVYLLRGLLNIFSLGMDDLAAKIQAKGISATVHNHAEWQSLADDIAARYKAGRHGPIVLIGHSLGADAVMFMGEYLGQKGVPVALIVPFDGTGSFAASSNVARVMNLTQRDYAHMRRGAGFRGELANIDVSSHGVGHIDIDKSARLHAMVLNKVQSVLRGGGAPRSQTAGNGASAAPRGRPAAVSDPTAVGTTTAIPATTASTAAPIEPALQKPVPAETAAPVPARSEAPAAKPALRF